MGTNSDLGSKRNIERKKGEVKRGKEKKQRMSKTKNRTAIEKIGDWVETEHGFYKGRRKNKRDRKGEKEEQNERWRTQTGEPDQSRTTYRRR